MIERATAVRTVEEELERERQAQAATGVTPTRVVVMRVDEHELVWKVYVQSEVFVRTGDPRSMLVGHGPFLVDRADGGLHTIGILSAHGGEWEADYRTRIRGLPARTAVEGRTAVDDLHDEARRVAAVRGRVQALRTLRRRLPTLSPAQAIEYLTALTAGDAPPHLATAVAELVKPIAPVDPVLAVRTLRPGSPGRPA